MKYSIFAFYLSLLGSGDARIDQSFGQNQPIVEFSDEKMNAMFEFNLPGRRGGASSSRSDYTPLEGGQESRPLVSRMVSSFNRFLQPR